MHNRSPEPTQPRDLELALQATSAKPPALPEIKTVEQYEREKEEEEIFKSFRSFRTINDINKSFGHDVNQAGNLRNDNMEEGPNANVTAAFNQTMNTTANTAGANANKMNKQLAVPCNKKTFQRFFEIKMQIK